MSFLSLGFGPELGRAVSDRGCAAPHSMQAQAIPLIHEGRDPMGCAPMNTSKKPNKRRYRAGSRRRMAA